MSKRFVSIPAAPFSTGIPTGMRTALAALGARHGVERDWARLANEFRRHSLKLIVNHGEGTQQATMTFDDAHRDALDQACLPTTG